MTYNKRHKIHTLLTYMFLCANTYINKKKQFSQKVKSRYFECLKKREKKLPLANTDNFYYSIYKGTIK